MYKQVYNFKEVHIGTFDGEHIYNFSGEIILRIDGNEAYTTEIPTQLIGIFEKNNVIGLDGSLLFNMID